MTDRFKSAPLPIGLAAITILFLVTVAATPPPPAQSTSFADRLYPARHSYIRYGDQRYSRWRSRYEQRSP